MYIYIYLENQHPWNLSVLWQNPVLLKKTRFFQIMNFQSIYKDVVMSPCDTMCIFDVHEC